MLKYVVVLAIFLVALGGVYADAQAVGEVTQGGTVQQSTDNAVQARVDEANRYLSAEVTRQLKQSTQDIVQQVNNNNDENFRQFDTRMHSLMQDTRFQVILGGIGAILVANALVAIIMGLVQKRYSFEYYQQQLIGKQSAEIDRLRSQLETQGVAQMQQQSWQIQEPAKTLGNTYGQAAVGNLSQMNSWQMQPTHQGAWQAPQENVQMYQPPTPYFEDYDAPQQQQPQAYPGTGQQQWNGQQWNGNNGNFGG